MGKMFDMVLYIVMLYLHAERKHQALHIKYCSNILSVRKMLYLHAERKHQALHIKYCSNILSVRKQQ